MATRLPTRDSALGQAPSGRSGRPIATYDVTAIGRGMQQLGKGIAQFGSGVGAAVSQHEAAQDQVAKFDTERKFQEFKWNETRGLDEMLRTVEPGQADGLADKWASGYQERAKGFFETVPDKFKPTYDQKLFGVERQGYGTTATFQRQEQKRFQLNKIEDLASTYSSRAGAGEPLDNIRKDYQDLLDASPWLTPIEKDEVLRKGLTGLEEAHVNGRLQRGEPLEDILNDLRGGALLDTNENPEVRAKPFSGKAEAGEARPFLSKPQQEALKKVDEGVTERFSRLQGVLGREFKINSGYRDPEHNRRVGGASKSRHIHGEAIDIDVSDLSEEERVKVIQEASRLGFTGIGVYKTAIHLDIGNRRAWGPSYGRESVPGWAERAIAAHESGASPSPSEGKSRFSRMAEISVRLETGASDPLEGVANISGDAGGTKSYGNFGLNSQPGGSIFAFKKQYGKELGLTATPGTTAFDRQWKAAAERAPDALHEAEMQWYGQNIASDVEDRLTSAGVPDTLADDPRVQAYFADRRIQYGPASIDGVAKHKQRIATAVKASGGNVETFLTRMSEMDRDALEKDFPTALRTGVYSARGHETRLSGRLEMALESAAAPEDAGDGSPKQRMIFTGPYQSLSAKQRETLIGKVQIASRNKTLQEVRDSAERLRRTGELPTDADGETVLDRASRVLTRNQLEKARIDLQSAQIEFEAMHGLSSLPEAELEDRIIAFEPEPNDDLYAERARIYEKLTSEVNQLRTLREKDPAAAVSDLPEVQIAEQGVKENPDDPEFIQKMVGARLDAQKSIGIPDGLQSPITKQEAKLIMAPARGLEGKAMVDALTKVQEDIQEKYGPYARAVAVDAISYITRSKEVAEEMTGILTIAMRGELPSASQVRSLEVATETSMAERAFGIGMQQDLTEQPENPQAVANIEADPFRQYGMRKAPQRAIDLLKSNPSLAPAFNEKYGPGTAEIILQGQ